MQKKRLYSEALDETIQFNTTAHALRCIDKAGGLDNYLKAMNPAELKTDRLQRIRQSIIAAGEK